MLLPGLGGIGTVSAVILGGVAGMKVSELVSTKTRELEDQLFGQPK
jgi:hypothetical protein